MHACVVHDSTRAKAMRHSKREGGSLATPAYGRKRLEYFPYPTALFSRFDLFEFVFSNKFKFGMKYGTPNSKTERKRFRCFSDHFLLYINIAKSKVEPTLPPAHHTAAPPAPPPHRPPASSIRRRRPASNLRHRVAGLPRPRPVSATRIAT